MTARPGDPSEDAPDQARLEVPARDHRLEVPRSARYYTAGANGAVDEIWVVLHGFGMLARRFLDWFAPAMRPGRLLVAPEALNHYYTDHRTRTVGATWMTNEDREAQIADYVRYLDLVLDDVRPAGSAPRIEVHGFSQGTATASRWVALGRVRPARLVLWGGGVPPDLDLAAHGPTLSGADLTMVIGDRDPFIGEEAVGAETARLRGAGVRFDLRRFRGGHVIPWPLLEELAR